MVCEKKEIVSPHPPLLSLNRQKRHCCAFYIFLVFSFLYISYSSPVSRSPYDLDYIMMPNTIVKHDNIPAFFYLKQHHTQKHATTTS